MLDIDIYYQGYRAGYTTVSNPYPEGSAQYQSWRQGQTDCIRDRWHRKYIRPITRRIDYVVSYVISAYIGVHNYLTTTFRKE